MASYVCDLGAGNPLLNFELGGAALTIPGTWYVGLSLSPATKIGRVINANGQGSEVSGGGYARVAVVNNLTSFPAVSGGSKSNGTAITFPTPTANWGTVYSVFIADLPTGGKIWRYVDLPLPLVISNGAAPPSIAAGALTFSHT
jgi:hypothetical protein